MDNLTRRSVLILGGAGAVTAAGAASGVSRVAASAAPVLEQPVALSQPVLVRVVDARSGAVELSIGEQSITFNDKALVKRIAAAASGVKA